jgi:hypothetical protein
MAKTELQWLPAALRNSPFISGLKEASWSIFFSIDHTITAAITMASMGSKVAKHLAHGTGPESLRAGRDVEFVVLILLLQVTRKKMLVECH